MRYRINYKNKKRETREFADDLSARLFAIQNGMVDTVTRELRDTTIFRAFRIHHKPVLHPHPMKFPA